MFGGCIGIVASVVAFSHIQLVEIVTDRELIKGEPATQQSPSDEDDEERWKWYPFQLEVSSVSKSKDAVLINLDSTLRLTC